MLELFATLGLFALAMLGLGVGAVLGRSALRGSCGGAACRCTGARRRACGRDTEPTTTAKKLPQLH